MKKHFLLLTMMAAFVLSSFATIRYVNNSTPSPEPYTTVAAAVAASANGDTIYVQPTTVNYTGAITITKKLTIIGGGYSPDKPTVNTTILQLDVDFAAGSSGSLLTGCHLQGSYVYISNSSIATLTVSRCYFNGTALYFTLPNATYVTNLSINECLFANSNNTTAVGNGSTYVSNVMFNNCVFKSPGCAPSACTTLGVNFNAQNWTFNNCLFFGFNNGSNNFSEVAYCNASVSLNFNHCIFNKVSLNYVYSQGTHTFTNCLSFGCQYPDPWTQTSHNIDGGYNLSNTDPQFANASSINSPTFSYTKDFFRVNSSSPTLVANHSGAPADMGPYGGSGVFTFLNANTPGIPLVHSLVLPTTTILSGQNLQIDVIGKKHN